MYVRSLHPSAFRPVTPSPMLPLRCPPAHPSCQRQPSMRRSCRSKCQQPCSKSGLQQTVALAGYEASHLHPAYDLCPSAHAGIRHRRLQPVASAVSLCHRSCSSGLAACRPHRQPAGWQTPNPKAQSQTISHTSPALASTLSPGALMAATSGTTIRFPTKAILSPALAVSTTSCLSTTSMVRGRLPAGTCSHVPGGPDSLRITGLVVMQSRCQQGPAAMKAQPECCRASGQVFLMLCGRRTHSTGRMQVAA